MATFLVLAGCAAVGPASSPGTALATALQGRVAGETRGCIPTTGTRSGLTAIDERTLAYDQGRVLWISRLASECPGIRPLATLIIEAHGSQYCRGDLVRANEPGSVIPGPPCALGAFTAYRKVR